MSIFMLIIIVLKIMVCEKRASVSVKVGIKLRQAQTENLVLEWSSCFRIIVS